MENKKLEAKAMECFMKNSMPYKIEAIVVSDVTTTYLGYAQGNPEDSDAKFAIMKIVETIVSDTTTTIITFPDGSIQFKYIWDDRATNLTYGPFSNQ